MSLLVLFAALFILSAFAPSRYIVAPRRRWLWQFPLWGQPTKFKRVGSRRIPSPTIQ